MGRTTSGLRRHLSATLLSLLIVIFCPRAVLATPPSPAAEGHLSLGAAIRIALEHNPRIAASQAEVAAAATRISGARSGLYPQIDISEDYRRTTNPTAAFGVKLNQESITRQDFDPARLNDPDAIDNFATTVTLTLPLFDRGQTWIGLAQAKLAKKAAELQAERTRQQVIADTIAAYAAVLLATAQVQVVEKALETARAHHQLIRVRLQSGLTVKSDLLRAEVRVAELEQQLFTARSHLQVSRTRVNSVMGVDLQRPLHLESELAPGPAVEGELDTWIATARQRRPDLARVHLLQQVAEEQVRKARAAHLPSLHLMSAYELNSEEIGDSASNYTIGAVARLNLFSGYRIQAQVEEAKAMQRRLQALERQLQLGIAVETKSAYLSARAAHQRIQVAAAAISQAEENLRIVRNRYQNGLNTLVDLMDAEVALQQARSNYLQALYDYMIARAQLALAAGTISPEFP